MKLNAAKRKKIPSSEFGLPGKRKYPMEDRGHAANAKSRATQQYDDGRLSLSELSQIRGKANRVLRRGRSQS